MKIYLAGKVLKGKEIGTVPDWRPECIRLLSKSLDAVYSMPDEAVIHESESFLIFGHDCYLVREADVTLVNAATKLGVGTAQEMLVAKHFNKPVVTVLPKDTHHRRTRLEMPAGIVDDWIHPFVHATSDVVSESFEEAAHWLAQYAKTPTTYRIKGHTIIEDAIENFLRLRHKFSFTDSTIQPAGPPA